MNKKMIYMTMICVMLFITTISFAYAFFSYSLNGEGKENVVTAGSLSIEYVDGQEIILDDAYPGDNITKTVTVTNTGTFDTSYDIIYKDLINEFLNDELVISYTCISYKDYVDEDNKGQVSGNCNSANEVVVPYSESAVEEILSEDISISEGITHEYVLTITFKEMGELQNYNKGKRFSALINVGVMQSDVQIALKLNGQTVSKLPSDGVYKLDSYSCSNGSVITWNSIKRKYYIEGEEKDSCTLEFTEADTLGTKLIIDNPVIKDDNADLFKNIADEESESGLFRTTDLSKTEDVDGNGQGEEVLYFRGVVENNYVSFANKCWRIVRTNESGKSIKLIYAGELNGNECYPPGRDNGINNATAYQYTSGTNYATSDKAKWVYGGESKNAKVKVDTWYETHIETLGEKVTSLIIDEPYCNDMSATSQTRLKTNKSPQYKCPLAENKYSINVDIGNGLLSKPIALITADEAAYAGAVVGTSNPNYYLVNDSEYWTLTYYGYNEGVRMYTIGGGGSIANDIVVRSALIVIVPVISISSEAIVADGTSGTYTNPYIIVTE